MSEPKIKFEDGAAYERMMGVWSQLIGVEFLQWLSPAPDQRWIDIGCGNGTFSEQIVDFCNPQEVQGIDPSKAQISFAKTRLEEKQATFEIGDAMALPFDDHKFDVATMALALFFVPDPVQGVAEMKRVVRSGGIVAAYMWDMLGGGAPMEPIHNVLRSRKIPYPLPPSAEASRMEDMRKLWADAGFQSVTTKVINVKRSFDSFEDFWNTTATSPALTSALRDLDAKTLEDVKHSTRELLAGKGNDPVICTGFANCITGVV